MEKIQNKKGDVSDIITFMIIIFFLGVAFIVVAFVNDKFYDVVNDTELNETTVAPYVLTHLNNMTTITIQRGFVAIFAFLIIGMMLSSFLVRIHPIFIFMYIIFLAVSVFSVIPLANAYQLLINADALSEVASQQTMITWIMQHIVMIILGVGALSIIITFAKLSEGGSPRL